MSKNKIAFYTFIGLLASSVMLPKVLPIFMIVLVLIWLWEGGFAKKMSAISKQPYLMLLPVLYLAFGFGMLYSDNLSYGFEKMETRLSLFVLPLLITTMPALNFTYNKRVYSRYFAHATTLMALFCVLRATTLYVYEIYILQSAEILEADISSNYFFYSELSSGIMHPGYLAMYVNTAIILCLWDIRRGMTKGAKMRRIVQAAFLALFVVLLYSKAGIAALMLILLAFGVRYAVLCRKWLMVPATFGVIFTLLLGVYFWVPNSQYRLNGMLESFQNTSLNPASTESTQTRIHAWKAARILISEKPAIGHGTGDAMDALFNKYDELGFTGARSKEMNAHNEYYQTGIALGLLGIALLFAVFLGALYLAYRRKNFALGLWSVCAFFVIYFEAYLNTQAGVVFLALFIPFLTLLKNDESAA